MAEPIVFTGAADDPWRWLDPAAPRPIVVHPDRRQPALETRVMADGSVVAADPKTHPEAAQPVAVVPRPAAGARR